MIFTKPAEDVFAPTTAGGAPRGAVMGEAQTWTMEVESMVGLFSLAPDGAGLGLGGDGEDDVALAIQTPPGAVGRAISIHHYPSGVGQYGLDIHQYKNAGATDANSAIAIHNYSADFPAMIIDSTDQQAILSLNNSENPVTSPGTKGTGPFIAFSGYAGSSPNTRRNLGYINNAMQFVANYDDVPWGFVGGLTVAQGPSGTSRALTVTAQNSGYAVTFAGTDGGLFVSTTAEGNNAFSAVKNGTGSGICAAFYNNGSGDTFIAALGAAGGYATVWSVTSAGVMDSRADRLRVRQSLTPASASAAGLQGQIAWDSSYIYVCIATNTWRRIAHATW